MTRAVIVCALVCACSRTFHEQRQTDVAVTRDTVRHEEKKTERATEKDTKREVVTREAPTVTETVDEWSEPVALASAAPDAGVPDAGPTAGPTIVMVPRRRVTRTQTGPVERVDRVDVRAVTSAKSAAHGTTEAKEATVAREIASQKTETRIGPPWWTWVMLGLAGLVAVALFLRSRWPL